MTKALFLSTSTLLAIAVNAQDVEQHLAKVNELFNGKARFKVDRSDRLVIDVLSEQGLVRQDVAYVEHLSADAVSYSDEEQAVVMKCSDEHDQCITKEIFKYSTKKFTGRSTLALGPGTKDEAIAALAALIRAAQEDAFNAAGATMPR